MSKGNFFEIDVKKSDSFKKSLNGRSMKEKAISTALSTAMDKRKRMYIIILILSMIIFSIIGLIDTIKFIINLF